MIGTLLTLLALAAGPASPQPAPAELLLKMAAADARFMTLYQSGGVTMSSHVEELDGDGKPRHTEEVVQKLVQRDGKPVSELVSASRDGKDITEERRSEHARGKKQGRDLSTPFGAAEQPRYAFTVLAPDPGHPELLKVGFAPRERPDPELWVGDALVDPATGEVRWMQQRLSKMPPFVDRFEMALDFSARTSQGPAVSLMKMEGEAGLPFFKKKFRVVTRFTDYQAR